LLKPEPISISLLTSVVTPAVVYARDDGTIVTGEPANRRAVSNPDRVGREFKRRLGDPTPVMLGGTPHAVTSLLAALLADAVAKVTETEGSPPANVVLTHPANWGPYRRELFEEVPQLAGVPQARMITEPEADSEVELGELPIRGVAWSGAAPTTCRSSRCRSAWR